MFPLNLPNALTMLRILAVPVVVVALLGETPNGDVIAGDPQRVIEVIHRWRERLGLTTISGTIFFGGMPQELALKNVRLFAERVIPAFTPAASRA